MNSNGYVADANKRPINDNQSVMSPRALLSPAKVVLIDEATANVDSETDVQLQQVIKERLQYVTAKCKAFDLGITFTFKSQVIQSCLADRTVLTIAHRVDTVLGCDRSV